MQDAVVNLIRVSLRDHQRFGAADAARSGNQLGRTVPGTTYACAPGGPNDYVFIFAQPQMWKAFIDVMGQPELADDPRFATPDGRWENRAALNAIVEAWTRQRSKHEVMRLMGDAGVPCGATLDTGEVLADPHLRARDMIVDVDYPTRGHLPDGGLPDQAVGLARRGDAAAAARRAHGGGAGGAVRRRRGRGAEAARTGGGVGSSERPVAAGRVECHLSSMNSVGTILETGHDALRALCLRCHVRRLDLFGSAVTDRL